MTDLDKKGFLEDVPITSFNKVLHSLRAPLNSIIGFTTLLENESYGPLSAEQREFLEIIQRNADEMLDLIDKLSLLAKSEEGL